MLYISTFQYISGSPKQPVVHGDVNGDNTVDIADVNAVINMMLGKVPSTAEGDVTGDGKVDISDVNEVINIMLGKAQASDFVGIADVTGDNSIDVSDVNTVINIMLGKI